MAARNVRFHPEAIAEAHAAYEWYAERNPSAATAFISELDHAIRQIKSKPQVWPGALAGHEDISVPTFPLWGNLPDH